MQGFLGLFLQTELNCLILDNENQPVLGYLGQMALSFCKSEQLTQDANSAFNGSGGAILERDNTFG